MKSSVFDNPVFKTIEELEDFSKFSDPLFIKQLNAMIEQVNQEMLFQAVVPKILSNLENNNKFLQDLFPTLLKCLQLPLNKKKAHLLGGNYSKLFGFVVDTVISDPKLYIG